MGQEQATDAADELTLAAQAKAAADKAKLDELTRKYGEGNFAAWPVPGFGVIVAVKPANHKAYETFVNKSISDDEDSAAASREFAMSCVMQAGMSLEDATKLFHTYPAFTGLVSARGKEFCGSQFKELGKA